MTCCRGDRDRPSKPPADVVTYRFNGKMVYVPFTPDYTKALSHARNVFPQLKGLRDASLSLSLADSPGYTEKCVGISVSALAWPKMATRLVPFQIIDVHVTRDCEGPIPIPDITITYADAEDVPEETEPAPPYRGLADEATVGDEKASVRCARPRTTSTSTLHPKRSWLFQKLHGQRAVDCSRA